MQIVIYYLLQPSLGGSAQYGSMSAIPSPPNVLFNSTQQMPTQGGLYGPFQLDQTQVLNTQGRSQYSQYPTPYGLGQTASSPYSAQSIYLQTPPHPPPSAQPPPDIYQNLSSQYRMVSFYKFIRLFVVEFFKLLDSGIVPFIFDILPKLSKFT